MTELPFWRFARITVERDRGLYADRTSQYEGIVHFLANKGPEGTMCVRSFDIVEIAMIIEDALKDNGFGEIALQYRSFGTIRTIGDLYKMVCPLIGVQPDFGPPAVAVA